MKIRLTGTREECAAGAEALGQVLTVREISDFSPNRGTSRLGRVYLDAHPITGPVPTSADHPPVTDPRSCPQDGGDPR